MSSNGLPRRTTKGTVVKFWEAQRLLLVVSLTLQASCEPDTRISVDEFLLMEHSPGPVTSTQPTTPPATQPVVTQLQPWAAGPYKVGPGDVISITVAGLEAVGLPTSQSIRINDNGQAVLPNVGPIPVGGLTLDQVEAAVAAAYSPKYIKETQVSAQVTTYRSVNIIVLGEVRTPAPLELRRDRCSILQAVLAAGGPSEFADGRVTLVPSRTPQEATTLDLNKRDDLVRAARIGAIQDSDVIIVERRSNDVVYVEGLVNNPGPVPVPRGSAVSALQAIGAAGGTLLAFDPKEATLMRRKPDGETLCVKLELNRMKTGQDPDIRLAAGDILVVPHNASTRTEELIARNLTLRFGVDTVFNPWTHYYFRKDRETQLETQGNGGFFGTQGRLLGSQGVTSATPITTGAVP
jgi:polysaccharide biosynthesis/export protein